MTPGPSQDLGAFIDSLLHRTSLAELALVTACVGLAWLVARTLRGRVQRTASVWFGNRIVDGVLFPALALGFTLLVRWTLIRWQLLTPVAVMSLAVPILASLVLIRVAVRVLRVAFPTSHAVRVTERTISWLVWIALVLWVTGLLPLLLGELESIQWNFGGANVSLRSLLEGALSAALVLVVALWISAAIESRLLTGATGNLSVRKIAANGVRVLLLVVGVMFALSAAGIPLGALSVVGGAIGVGIGFGLQKLASNYVSGFVILAERSLRIGDMVRVDNFEGRITDISTRYTVVRALNGRESLVPNEMLITQRVESFTLADTKVALNTTVQVAYGTDLEALIPRLIAAIGALPRVLSDPAPGVMLQAFAADGLELNITFWIADSENGTGNVRSEVNLQVLRTLDAAGVEIPFPQRVVRQLSA